MYKLAVKEQLWQAGLLFTTASPVAVPVREARGEHCLFFTSGVWTWVAQLGSTLCFRVRLHARNDVLAVQPYFQPLLLFQPKVCSLHPVVIGVSMSYVLALRLCGFVDVAELDPTQPVPEPVLHQSGPLSGGAGQGLLLEDRPRLWGQADRTGLQETQAQGGSLLQDSCGSSLLQVCNAQTWVCYIKVGGVST